MKTWFKCTARYQKQDDEGRIKRVTEKYLVDAVSFTDAETNIFTRLEKEISGVEIVNISKFNITEVINYEDSEDWYKCKMTFISVEEESEKAKKVTNNVLVSASSVKEAEERLTDNLSSMLVPFEIPSISKTDIIDVYVFESED